VRTAALLLDASPTPSGFDQVFRGQPATLGEDLRTVLSASRAEVVVVDPPADPTPLFAPLAADQLDAVVGARRPIPLLERPLAWLARLALGPGLADAASPARALRVSALRELHDWSPGPAAEAEVLAGLAAAQFRLGEVEVRGTRARRAAELRPLLEAWRKALVAEDAPTLHDGDATLRVLEAGAPNYNGWLADTYAAWAGRRVLEVGAGQGTITARLAPGRELVTALELEAGYVERLRRRFRGHPEVEPLQADVLKADPETFRARGYDTIVLSNVLEHLADDARAVSTFARILEPGGRLIVFVPAGPALFGTMDAAVGHHRRYTEASLRAVLGGHGFDLLALRPMNLVGIPGWFVNGRVLRRTSLPPLQVRVYDALAPALASLEARVRLPVGLSLFAVGQRRTE
jgi:SAM-dependent methyltransferase